MTHSDGINVRIYRRYFVPAADGSGEPIVTREDTEDHDFLSPVETVELLRRSGVEFGAHSTRQDTPGARPARDYRASDPDGSYITDYGTGERCETLAVMSDVSPLRAGVIVRATDSPDRPRGWSVGRKP